MTALGWGRQITLCWAALGHFFGLHTCRSISIRSIMSHLLYFNRTKVSEGEAHLEEELPPHRHLYWKLCFVSWMFPAQGLCWLLWPQAAKSPSCSGAPTTAGSPEPAAAPFLPRLGKPHLAQRLGKTQLTLRDSPAHPLLLLVPLPHLFLCLWLLAFPTDLLQEPQGLIALPC